MESSLLNRRDEETVEVWLINREEKKMASTTPKWRSPLTERGLSRQARQKMVTRPGATGIRMTERNEIVLSSIPDLLSRQELHIPVVKRKSPC